MEWSVRVQERQECGAHSVSHATHFVLPSRSDVSLSAHLAASSRPSIQLVHPLHILLSSRCFRLSFISVHLPPHPRHVRSTPALLLLLLLARRARTFSLALADTRALQSRARCTPSSGRRRTQPTSYLWEWSGLPKSWATRCAGGCSAASWAVVSLTMSCRRLTSKPCLGIWFSAPTVAICCPASRDRLISTTHAATGSPSSTSSPLPVVHLHQASSCSP